MLRENVGKVAVILAGGGCLALMMFVVWPQMFEPAPSMTPGEIVEEVLGPEAEQGGRGTGRGWRDGDAGAVAAGGGPGRRGGIAGDLPGARRGGTGSPGDG